MDFPFGPLCHFQTKAVSAGELELLASGPDLFAGERFLGGFSGRVITALDWMHVYFGRRFSVARIFVRTWSSTAVGSDGVWP
jgi:hypothetical protein